MKWFVLSDLSNNEFTGPIPDSLASSKNLWLVVAQETLLYKDEHIREAHNWMARMQENVLQSTTLQAELRERTYQYTQLWLGIQNISSIWENLEGWTLRIYPFDVMTRWEVLDSYILSFWAKMPKTLNEIAYMFDRVGLKRRSFQVHYLLRSKHSV